MKTIRFIIFSISTFFARIAWASPASSAFNSSAKNTAVNSGLTNGDAPVDVYSMLGGYIDNLLNFLGVAFFILIIYGGIMWMIAAGNDQKIEKAKKIIISSTVGLAIILLSKVIAFFIVDIIAPTQ